MEKTDVKGRIVEFCTANQLSKNKFEQLCGLTRGYLANPTTKPSVPVLERIHEQFPDLNMNWLLFGEGTMIVADVLKERQETFETIQSYDDAYEALKEKCERLKQCLQEKSDALALVQSKYIALLEKMSEGNISSHSHTA